MAAKKKIEKINIQDLVKKAQGRFSGKDAAKMSSRMSTGSEIVMSKDPDDYIAMPDFWGMLTGTMGIPFGRIAQFAGKPDAGKSTAAMLAMKAAQEKDVIVILWDTEGKFDSARFRDRMGGDPGDIPVAPSKNITEGVQQVVAYIKAIKEMKPDQKVLVVWDSVGASINTTEDDEENDDYSKQPGVTAKQVSWAIRRFNQLMEKTRTDDGTYTMAVLCVNQVYANIGSVGTKQKGGAELEYLCSIIIELSRKQTLTRVRQKQKIKYGIKSVARVKKNHLFGGEDCIAELDLIVTASGIELADKVKETDLIEEE